MSFFDIVLDFILMDAFEDLENPPSSVLAVLRNRWLSDSFKETVCGRPPLPGTHTRDPTCVAQTSLHPWRWAPGLAPYSSWSSHPHPPGAGCRPLGAPAPALENFPGKPPLLSSHPCKVSGRVFSSCLIVSFGQFYSFSTAINSIPFECIQSS